MRTWLSTVMLGLVVSLSGCGGASGDELDVGEPYGATMSRDVGIRLTDGVTAVEVLKGPITLISVKPILDDGGTLTYLGARVRLLGQPGREAFTSVEGFPPKDPKMLGSVPVENFEIPAPVSADERLYFELSFGFEITAEGRTARRGAEMTYEYDGGQRTVFVPSYFAACSPRSIGTDCPDEGPNGPDRRDSPAGAMPAT